MMKSFLFISLVILLPLLTVAQGKDSSIKRNDTLIVKDSAGNIVPVHTVPDSTKRQKKAAYYSANPRIASLRSAIIPGWGQITNRKYWKVPIVYTAIGIPVGLFFDNKKWYNKTRYALAVLASGTALPDSLNKVDPRLRPLVDIKAQGSLINYRNEFRKNMDYSVLFTLLFWGLNIVDATVDAHLRGFNVSDDLSFKINPAILSGNAVGLSLAFTLGKNHTKTIPSF